ncbi:MAG: fibronectin type III domain-containing protein, partial [Clostridia bacterium]|nr:fibronectin type III domain-containing protein [Clostridia bacterium]
TDTYTYDSKGNITKDVYKSSKGNSYSYTYSYKYDDAGNIVKKTKKSPEGTLTSTYEYKKAAKAVYFLDSTEFIYNDVVSYTGKAVYPALTVFKVSDVTYMDALNKKIDYEISYKNNTKPGNASMTLTFSDGTNVTLPFRIQGKVTGLKAEPGKSSIKLSWTKYPDAKYYKVQQSTDGKTWKTVKTVSAASLTVKELTAGKKYQYRVTALDGSKKALSKVSAVLKTGTRTNAPTVTLKSTKSKTAAASWKKVTGAAKYLVYKSTDGKKWTKLTTVTGTSYTLTKLTGGKKIYVKIYALNAYGKYSAASAVKSVTVKK